MADLGRFVVRRVAQFMALLLTREQAFPASAKSKIVQSVSYVAAAIGIGAAAPIPATLVIADVIARFVNSAYLAIWSITTMPWIWRPRVGKRCAVSPAVIGNILLCPCPAP